MRFSEVFSASQPVLSFELFPPKSEQGDASLMEHVRALMRYSPRFITCTYGAGGSTRGKTLEIVERVKRTFHVPVASHLTCVGSSVGELRDYLREAQDRDVDFIVALRGDPPKGESSFTPPPDGFRFASELVAMIDSEFPRFGIAVAGYPEVHQEAISPAHDLENLKRKIDNGGEIVITQLFYRNTDYFEFCQRAAAIGIDVPIVPGILPVTNLAQIQRITQLCKAFLPPDFVARLSEKDDPEWQTEVGVEFASRQVAELLSHGAPGIHFYVLNKSHATAKVLDQVQWPG